MCDTKCELSGFRLNRVRQFNVGNGCRDCNFAIKKRMNTHRKTIQLILATFISVAGLVLIGAGFVVPPVGSIDASVLTAFGEILTFAGALFGMDYHYKNK